MKLQLEGHESFKMENQGLKTAIQDAEVRASSHERMATHLRNEKHNLDTVIEGLRLEVEKQKLENAHLKSNEVFRKKVMLSIRHYSLQQECC